MSKAQKSPIKRVFTVVFNVLSIILVVCSLALLIFMLCFSGGKVRSVFGYSMFNILTSSMEDELPKGSLIIVKKTDVSDLSTGDIITFISSDPTVPADKNGLRIVTHKVIAVNRKSDGTVADLNTKGVNNPKPDDYPVLPDNVLGKVVYSSEKLGKAYDLLSRKGLSFVLTVVPLFVIVVIAFVDFVLAFRRMKDEDRIKKKAKAYMKEHNIESLPKKKSKKK